MTAIQILLSVVYFFACNASIKHNKLLRYLMNFLVIWYSLQLVLAIADPYKHYEISSITIIAFNLQILFFILGARTFSQKHIHNDVNYDNNSIFNIKPNNFLLIIQTLFVLYTYRNFSKMQSYLLSLDGITNDARSYYFNEFYGSYTDVMINQIMLSYSLVSYFLLFGLAFFQQRKLKIKDYYIIVSSLATVVFTSLTTMGRFEMMELVFIYIFFLLYSRVAIFSDTQIKKKVTTFGIAIAVMMVCVISTVTMFRNNLMSDNSDSVEALSESFSIMIIEPFVTYFYCPIQAFDYGVDHVFGDLAPMFGGATCAGIIDFLLLPIVFFFHDLPTMNLTIGSAMTPTFYFPSGRHWNALFTGASNYYIDFGYFGFIIFPFIMGWILCFVSTKCKNKGKWFIVLLFMFMALYKSAFMSGFQSTGMVFTFIWILVLRKYKAIS